LLCPAFAPRAEIQDQERNLLSLLPEGPELRGWAREGEPQSFRGEDLFTYIDGGAEIYFEYGFGRVIVQDYRNEAGHRLNLEIFEMESPEAAYGMFTFKIGPRGEAVVLGDECQLADYYLNLCQGRYLITITGLEAEAAAGEGLVALARLVEGKLGERGKRPSLVSVLPGEGLKPWSLKLFRGPLALYNTHPFFKEDVFSFRKGIKGEYADGGTLFLFEYDTNGAAEGRFFEVRRKFAAEPRYRDLRWDGDLFAARDEKGWAIFARLSGRFIVLVLNDDDRDAAENLMARLEKRLMTRKEDR
jgi:hypothetical protein